MDDHTVLNSMVQREIGEWIWAVSRHLVSVWKFSVMDDHTVLHSMVKRGRERWVDLGSFMTPGLSKDLQCHG